MNAKQSLRLFVALPSNSYGQFFLMQSQQFGESLVRIFSNRRVSFMDYDLGYIDLEEKTLQPLENPFGP
jgi:hypothetical protein